MGTHTTYGITQCYLSLVRAHIPAFTPAKLVLDLATLEVFKAYLPTHTHTRLTALFLGLPRWAGTRKVKPIWILLKQETVSGSGSGISWAICKSAPCSRQTTTPAPHHSVFTGRMPFMPPDQQRQSIEGLPTYLVDWQHTEMVYLPEHGHPSKY